MAKTQSEKWFEQFCNNKGLFCEPVERKGTKTPDYVIKMGDRKIIVEVKEFSRNKEEKKWDELRKVKEFCVISDTPGKRVRNKITDSSKQIKAGTKGKHPGILILCDIQYGHGIKIDHTRPYDIMVAMYGTGVIKYPKYSSTPIIEYNLRNISMTENDNTSISAIGVLSTSNEDDVELDIYHNKYASQQLDRKLLSKHGIRQFQVIQSYEYWDEIRV